jgi:peptidoglycan-associated lipoprotein
MFIRRIFFTFAILFMTISCSTSGRGGFGFSGGKDELASNVPNYVLFDVDSSKIESNYAKVLDDQAEWIKSNSDVNVVIEGHCDERGTREYNLALGAKRSNAVKSYLISAGVNATRIATISYGKERPAVQGSGMDVWQQNRRATTLIN